MTGTTDASPRQRHSKAQGLHGIVPPLITPLDEEGRLDRPSLTRLVEHQITAGVQGVFVAGSSGEAALLSDELRSELTRAAVSAAARHVPVLAGVVDTGTDRVVDHALRAVQDGADAIVATAPFYVQASAEEISAHYRRIAAAVPVPVIAYNIPSNVHIVIPPSVIGELARDGIIAGLKDSSGDLTALRAYLAAVQGTGLAVLSGSETVSDVSIQIGADGVVPGLGNVDPAGYVRLFRAARGGDAAAAAEEQLRLIRLFRITSVPTSRGLGPTAAALGAFKAALWLLGVIEHPRTQRPLAQLDVRDIDAVRAVLIECGLTPTR